MVSQQDGRHTATRGSAIGLQASNQVPPYKLGPPPPGLPKSCMPKSKFPYLKTTATHLLEFVGQDLDLLFILVLFLGVLWKRQAVRLQLCPALLTTVLPAGSSESASELPNPQ